MENYGKWKVEKSLYNNPKIAIEKESRNCNRKENFTRRLVRCLTLVLMEAASKKTCVSRILRVQRVEEKY